MSKTSAPDDHNPEWTDADFARARPFPEMFPELARKLKVRGRRPRLERPKVHVGFRLVADAVSPLNDNNRMPGPRLMVLVSGVALRPRT